MQQLPEEAEQIKFNPTSEDTRDNMLQRSLIYEIQKVAIN